MALQFLINGLIIGSVYALVSLGFSLIYNTTKIFHISYAVLYMICPYFLLTFYKSLELPLLIAFIFAVLITMGLSLLIDLIVYRPLSKEKRSSNIIMISSIGVMTIIINLIAMLYGNEKKILTEVRIRIYYHYNNSIDSVYCMFVDLCCISYSS